MVRNPEIAALSEVLLAALADPSEHTKAALDKLSSTAFVHAIDAPSLALIVPILRSVTQPSMRARRAALLPC